MRPIPLLTASLSTTTSPPEVQFKSNPSARQSKSKDSAHVREYAGTDIALLSLLPLLFPRLGVLLLGVSFTFPSFDELILLLLVDPCIPVDKIFLWADLDGE
jgi:hypothetical protein